MVKENVNTNIKSRMEQELDNALIKRMVLAWDSDFTKLTPAERQRLELAEKEVEAGEIVLHDEIDWN